ncbi:MaoC family dehydratase [Microbacterium sp. 18062]|uniref:MaoC family dehydratase n=1 Tax=Microbacterium sp. 18062 TaxID=2681410 RepID=UPI00135A3F39|nr:MaoC family dehydratase [Microbacterium sp. 18062]
MNVSEKVSVPISEVAGLHGADFGPSSWRTVTQEEVNLFARVTGDPNPIHLDADFAAGTPFGQRIVHGLLTLSLVVPQLDEVFEVTGAGMGINYGLNRVRFPAPVPVGARIRIRGTVSSVVEIDGGYQLEVPVTFDVEGSEKPACVAEFVLRLYR